MNLNTISQWIKLKNTEDFLKILVGDDALNYQEKRIFALSHNLYYTSRFMMNLNLLMQVVPLNSLEITQNIKKVMHLSVTLTLTLYRLLVLKISKSFDITP